MPRPFRLLPVFRHADPSKQTAARIFSSAHPPPRNGDGKKTPEREKQTAGLILLH